MGHPMLCVVVVHRRTFRRSTSGKVPGDLVGETTPIPACDPLDEFGEQVDHDGQCLDQTVVQTRHGKVE